MERIMGIPAALRIYFLPFFAQGHQIPLVDLARLVAYRGQHVTILSTPSNAVLFHKIVDDDRASGHHIRVHILNFPSKQVGLPEGVENLSGASDNATAGKIHMAAYMMQAEVEALLKQSPPDVFIPDIMFTWSEAAAKRVGVPRLVFNPISIFDVCMMEAIQSHPEAFEGSENGPYHIPGLPHPLTLPVRPSPGFARLSESLIKGEDGSHGVIVNSFAELDVDYTQHYEKLTGRKVWHVGPTSLMIQRTLLSSSSSSPLKNEEQHECLTWLNTKENASVVYICFGSLCRLSDAQLYEIAVGLEASGHQFLWVVHRKEPSSSGWLPQGFEERMMKKENRGMIIKGWAPQPQILNHEAIGGFVTHCGWNAVVEAISAGVPMITMPGFSDQYYNEKLITEVHGFGVEVGAAEWSMSPYDAKTKVVSAERIEKAVKRLMNEDGEMFRRIARELKEKAWKAVEVNGSSHNSLTALIRYLSNPNNSQQNGSN